MYSTCIFCNSSLGANEAIEHFPVGRRLAFDAATGRLWVVCKSCARWNLSPLETRWEAIEEAERQFRATKLRVSTDNIGLAQLKEGTELVRIGKPLQSEFAAWRYGEQFAQRHRRQINALRSTLTVSLGTLGMSVALPKTPASEAMIIAVMTGVLGVNAVGIFMQRVKHWKVRHEVRGVVRLANGHVVRMSQHDAEMAKLVATDNGNDWQLNLPLPTVMKGGVMSRAIGVTEYTRYSGKGAVLQGDAALRALATLMPHVNRLGAGSEGVQAAVDIVNNAPGLSHLLHTAATTQTSIWATTTSPANEAYLSRVPKPVSLALEMSIHTNDERRAMEGELAELEDRWRDADAIAKISDEMFLSNHVQTRVNSLRGPQ